MELEQVSGPLEICAAGGTQEPIVAPFAPPNGSPLPAFEASVGSRGDAYDNALAESVIGLFKTEVIHHDGPWRSLVSCVPWTPLRHSPSCSG
jgi:hypothetical protein